MYMYVVLEGNWRRSTVHIVRLTCVRVLDYGRSSDNIRAYVLQEWTEFLRVVTSDKTSACKKKKN